MNLEPETEILKTPPIMVMSSSIHSMLVPSHSPSSKGRDSNSSLIIDNDKKLQFLWENIGSSPGFHDEIVTKQNFTNNRLCMVNHRERKKDRSKTIQPRKSSIDGHGEEND